MQVNSASSYLSDLIEQGGAQPGASTPAKSFQQVAAEIQVEQQAAPPEAAATASPERATGSPALATEVAFDDSIWEIEAENPEMGQAAMAAVEALFEKNGIQPGRVKMRYVEELAVCPLVRSWTNRSLIVEYPDGTSTKFDAAETIRRPDVTLCTMLERLGAEGPVIVNV